MILFQLVQRNGNPGFRYMQNARNIVDTSMLPQGPLGPVMPMPINLNGMPVVPMDAARRSPSIPISALASATPENQHAV